MPLKAQDKPLPTNEPPQMQTSPSDSGLDHLSIKERAYLLQFQLFGMSSIRHSFFSKDEDGITSPIKSLIYLQIGIRV